ncbi:MAG: carbonic anhydrase family protein [Planctomycetia bacterium]|nr:carbonic anhydrase family protein [Planctomycetia bacterium]
MNIFNYIILTCVFVFLPCIPAPLLFADDGEHIPSDHWDYEGELGPDHWDKLVMEKWHCKIGDMQSPIGISVTEKAKLDNIVFHYYTTPLEILNNGHTIQINYEKGSSITIGHKKYDLVQFHFHTPGEHVIHGKHYPMEAHLVHKGEHGQLVVVAIPIEKGKENLFINTLWSNFPKDVGNLHIVSDVRICASQLLPKNTTAYYTYTGSLTTPPCTEHVNWFILKTPIEVSEAGLHKFTSLFKHDARPIQPIHERVVRENY